MTPVVVTHAAAVGSIPFSGVLSGTIVWSYSTTPTGGSLVVSDGTNTLLSFSITSAGHDRERVTIARPYTASCTLTITLADGGSAVVGSLNFIRD